MLQSPFGTPAPPAAAHQHQHHLRRCCCSRALDPSLSQGPITQHKTSEDIFSAQSFGCWEEQPGFPHISTLKSVQQARQTKQLLSGSPTPLLRWKNFNCAAGLQDCGAGRDAATSHILTFCLPRRCRGSDALHLLIQHGSSMKVALCGICSRGAGVQKASLITDS